MPVTNKSVFDSASTVFHELADEIFGEEVPGQWSTFADTMPTNSKTNTLDVLEAMPVVREWVGPKQYPDVNADSLTLTMKQYEASFSLKRIDLAGDQTGQIGKRIRQWLGAVSRFYDKIATDVLLSASGAGPTCYDGQALFSTAHPRGPANATQSNLSTTALSFAQHDAVRLAMASYRDVHSEPLGISPNLLMCGPKLEKLAKEITQSTERMLPINASGVEAASSVIAASTIPNVFGGGDTTLVINPRLVGTYDDYYYYLDTTRGVKPIMGFEMRKVEAHEQTDMDGTPRFELDELRFSLEADVVFGAGVWQVAYAGIVS